MCPAFAKETNRSRRTCFTVTIVTPIAAAPLSDLPGVLQNCLVLAWPGWIYGVNTLTGRRYLFLCPDARTASGGIAVIYDTVKALVLAGHDAVVVHNSASAGYPDYEDAPPMVYTLACWKVRMPYIGRRARLKEYARRLTGKLTNGPLSYLQLRSTDVVVAPELMLADALAAFPHQEVGIFVQNPFTFQKAYVAALSRGHDVRQKVKWYIGIANLCEDQFMLLDMARHYYIPVSMKPEEFPYRGQKEELITYMPRRRVDEAKIMAEALRRRGHVGGYSIEALDGLPREAVSEKMQRSRFFISLVKEEGLAFPVAEAMAAGCIVVGYTGLGARDYFTEETGIPVVEDDTAGLVRALEAAVEEYQTDPKRLDALRWHASEVVRQRYSRQAFEDALLDTWAQIDGVTGHRPNADLESMPQHASGQGLP